MLDKVDVAVIQAPLRPVVDFTDFADWVTASLEPAEGADLVVLPELVTVPLFTISTGWERDSFRPKIARISAFTQDYRALFCDLSAQKDQVILAGTQLVTTANGMTNSAHVFLPDRSFWTHDKTHLDPAERSWNTVEGTNLRTLDIDGVRIGIAICYEAEIPEVCTILSRQGADIILCPSYVSSLHGYWRIRHSGAARCVENLVYFVHCPLIANLGGTVPVGLGHATVLTPCDPGFPEDGVLAEGGKEIGVLRASLDLALLRANRRQGASTYIDRPQHSHLYRLHSEHLFAARNTAPVQQTDESEHL